MCPKQAQLKGGTNGVGWLNFTRINKIIILSQLFGVFCLSIHHKTIAKIS